MSSRRDSAQFSFRMNGLLFAFLNLQEALGFMFQ
jgi:hypothetical protein